MTATAARVALLREDFVRRFGRACTVIARAPGRVNLIGEHTDYNDGLVLPIALQQSTWVTAAARSDGVARAYSTTLDEARSWPVLRWTPGPQGDWSAYVAGVEQVLSDAGATPTGCDLLITSDIPVGGGLSSSAALELATALVLARLAGVSIEAARLAELCRAAEHRYAGVPCGIMDQYACALARVGCALLLDCRTRDWRHVALGLAGCALVVVHSGISHNLASSEYANRRAECEAATRALSAIIPGIRSLRDVPAATLARHSHQLVAVLAARARHVVTEIERTNAAVMALEQADALAFGKLLNASHRSLSEDYGVSTPEMDHLVGALQETPGVLGARMTGGGFGGCIVALVQDAAVERVDAAISRIGVAVGEGRRPVRLACRAGGGAEVVYEAGG